MEDVRRALDLFHHAAGEGGWRICIVDCMEDLNRSGANALLKLLEEPPQRSLFLMISHRPARILPTIRSRSRMLSVPALNPAQIRQAVAALDIDAEPDEIASAAARSGGSVRRALRLLDGERRVL